MSEPTPADRWCSEKDYLLPPKLVAQFEDICYRAAKQMFGLDCNASLPIQIKIIDRTRFEPDYYTPVPYEHKSGIYAVEEAALNNLEMALERIQKIRRIKQFRKGN